MWKNSYRTPTECWQKTSDFPKGKKLPTYLSRAKEKRKKQRQKNTDRTCTSGWELWRRKTLHRLGSPFTGRDGGWWGGSFGATEDSTVIRVQRAKQRDSRTEDWCWPALTSLRGLSAQPLGAWGLGVEAPASEVRSQGENWGWLCEHSLKVASATHLAKRESRKMAGPAYEARDHCFRVRKERGFRASPKWAPEMGASHGYQRGYQRWARNANAAAAATKKPVCKHSTPSTPPLLGNCAAHHGQGPMIQGQLPQENTWCASA